MKEKNSIAKQKLKEVDMKFKVGDYVRHIFEGEVNVVDSNKRCLIEDKHHHKIWIYPKDLILIDNPKSELEKAEEMYRDCGGSYKNAYYMKEEYSDLIIQQQKAIKELQGE